MSPPARGVDTNIEKTLDQLMSRIICTIDLGTTNLKVALVDATGHIVALTSVAAPELDGPHGHFDPDVYLELIQGTVRDVIDTEAIKASDIVGLSFSSQRSTLVLIDADGKASGPAWSWQGTGCGPAY